MISEKEQDSDFSTFIQFFKKYSRTILIYTLIGALGGFFLSFLIPKEYKSAGVVYPPSSTSIENSIEFPNFGYDLEADRLIQIFESREIRDSVIKKFDLIAHFNVDKSNPIWLETLNRKYFSKILFERGPSMSVNVSAQTKDPLLSAAIVNYIFQLTDQLREKIYKKNINAAFVTAKIDYELQQQKVDSAEVILIGKLKQNNMSSLLMLLSDAQISIDIDKLNASGVSASQSTLGADLLAYKASYDLLKEYKGRYIKIKKSYTNPIPRLFVINYAEANFKKVFPSYSTNILIAALFALFVSTVVLLIRYNYARY